MSPNVLEMKYKMCTHCENRPKTGQTAENQYFAKTLICLLLIYLPFLLVYIAQNY